MKGQKALFILRSILMLVLGWNLFGQKSQDRVYVMERVCRKCHPLNGDRNQFNIGTIESNEKSKRSQFLCKWHP